jgi:hypothetical protein
MYTIVNIAFWVRFWGFDRAVCPFSRVTFGSSLVTGSWNFQGILHLGSFHRGSDRQPEKGQRF